MSPLLTDDEIARRLRAQGVPDRLIEAHLVYQRSRGRSAGYVRRADTPPQPLTTLTTTDPTTAVFPVYAPPRRPSDLVESPIVLRIPWSALVSDNQKLRAAKRGDTPTVVLTPQYREAKRRIRALCVAAMAGRPALAVPLALEARVWVPDRHRRDVVNFSKALHDALTGTVFQDDSWLHDVRWLRAGVDIDQPRAELTIRPI